jgi:hypothetical protein
MSRAIFFPKTRESKNQSVGCCFDWSVEVIVEFETDVAMKKMGLDSRKKNHNADHKGKQKSKQVKQQPNGLGGGGGFVFVCGGGNSSSVQGKGNNANIAALMGKLPILVMPEIIGPIAHNNKTRVVSNEYSSTLPALSQATPIVNKEQQEQEYHNNKNTHLSPNHISASSRLQKETVTSSSGSSSATHMSKSSNQSPSPSKGSHNNETESDNSNRYHNMQRLKLNQTSPTPLSVNPTSHRSTNTHNSVARTKNNDLIRNNKAQKNNNNNNITQQQEKWENGLRNDGPISVNGGGVAHDDLSIDRNKMALFAQESSMEAMEKAKKIKEKEWAEQDRIDQELKLKKEEEEMRKAELITKKKKEKVTSTL